jgi:aspartate aminotransferase
MPPSPIRKLMPFAVAAKKRGVQVLHLNIGQPDLPTPPVMVERLKNLPATLEYSPSEGTPEYLAALARYYTNVGLPLEPHHLIATTGGSEALLFAFMACADEGDEALVVEPYYTNYNSFAEMAGVTLIPLTSHGEDGFHLPARADWEAKLTPHTKFVILCNPSNPTGTVYDEAELRMVAEFCRDHDLFLIADEVYREFVYDGRESISALSLAGFEDRVIVVDSLSKRFSACGIRLGALVTKNEDVRQCALHMAQGRLSPPGLAQVVATGMDQVGKDYFDSVATEYQARRDLLFDGLNQIPGVFLRKPEGAFYFVVRLPIDASEQFCQFMLEEFSLNGSTVMMAPAPGFYGTPGLGGNEVRIAYVLKKERLEQAVEIIAGGIAAFQGRSVPV